MSMTSIQRFRQAPVTIEEAKLNIFAPLKKITDKERYTLNEVIYDDEDFKVKISGIRLTQLHRDILDIILFYGQNIEVKESIPIKTFSLYSIQKHLGRNKFRNDWIIKKLEEIKRTVITLENKKTDEVYEFNIVRASKRSNKLNTYVLIIEELYLAFFENAISIDYKKLLDDILQLKHAATKAAVRFLITHKDGMQIKIDNLLEKVGVTGTDRNIRKIRKEVVEELLKEGEKFNINVILSSDGNGKINGNTIIKYTRHEDIKIYYSQQPDNSLIHPNF